MWRAFTKHFRLVAVALATVFVTAGAPVCGAILVDSSTSVAAQTRCCKVCKKGKACGDTCIAKSKKCAKKKGCACNG